MSGVPTELTDPDLFAEENGDYFDYPVYFMQRLFGADADLNLIRLAFPAHIQPTPSAGKPLTGRQNVNVSINGATQPIEFVIDSGADFNIIRTESANLISFKQTNPIRQQSITTAGGQTHQAPVFNATFSIEGQPTINVELVVFAESPFNLIMSETLGQSFTATVNASGGFDLAPKGGATPKPIPTTPTTPTPPVPPALAPPPAGISKTNNPIFDIIRELYRALCTLNPKIPLLCNSPWHFLATLVVLIVLIIIFAVKG